MSNSKRFQKIQRKEAMDYPYGKELPVRKDIRFQGCDMQGRGFSSCCGAIPKMSEFPSDIINLPC
ncbi:MAG: hypothetical protein FWH52_04455 [Synergistaceae bacterium]|nr:hypothetical protein [Synergistaceae bacterium]